MPHDYGFDPSMYREMGILGSNELVIDRHDSHAHLEGEGLEIALFLIDSEGRDYLVEQVDCGKVIGHDRCVETSPQDPIVYGYRHGREGLTRFVLDRKPEPTTNATAVLKRHDQLPGIMILISTWAGNKGQPEPWDENLQDAASLSASQAFWSNHALILNNTEIQAEIDVTKPHGTAKEMAGQVRTMLFSEPA